MNKIISFYYDKESKVMQMSVPENIVVNKNGESKHHDPHGNIIKSDDFIKDIAKENLEEMLQALNEN